jgi:hypothetical protein
MLNYVKKILRKVSFDKALFEKELRKAISTLIASEVEELKRWCFDIYGKQYPDVLNSCFIQAV